MESFFGEIRLWPGDYAPAGWMFCHGQVLQVEEYPALFSLIRNSYGGDGTATFALPDLRGRAPTGVSATEPLGRTGGTASVRLTIDNYPGHTHDFLAATWDADGSGVATGKLLGGLTGETGQLYGTRDPGAVLTDGSVTAAYVPAASEGGKDAPLVGGNAPHENLQPYLCLDFIIAVEGIYPTPY